MQVRKASPEDIPAVLALECYAFTDPWGEDVLFSHLNSEHLCFLVCEDGDVFCGYLLGSRIPPEGEIYRVATHPERLRRGVGRMLCEHFLSDCGEAFLEVRRSNTAARALYEKLGFSLVGERRNYYKNPTEDACLYRWDLK